MGFDWLTLVKELPELVLNLGELVKNNRALKDQLIRELKLNLKAFETAQKGKTIQYDKLLSLLKNEQIQIARKQRFAFNTIKSGEVSLKHIHNDRNKKYVGKTCAWLFKNIDEKIEDLRIQQHYHGSLSQIENSKIPLQFSNLLYKLKLLADFIVD